MHLDILRSNIANHIFFSHENVGLHRFVQSKFSLHTTTTSTKKWLLHWIPFAVKGLHPYFFHHINDVVYKLQLLSLVVHFHCDCLVLDNYFDKMLAWYGHHDPLCSEVEQYCKVHVEHLRSALWRSHWNSFNQNNFSWGCFTTFSLLVPTVSKWLKVSWICNCNVFFPSTTNILFC